MIFDKKIDKHIKVPSRTDFTKVAKYLRSLSNTIQK